MVQWQLRGKNVHHKLKFIGMEFDLMKSKAYNALRVSMNSQHFNGNISIEAKKTFYHIKT